MLDMSPLAAVMRPLRVDDHVIVATVGLHPRRYRVARVERLPAGVYDVDQIPLAGLSHDGSTLAS